VNEDVSTNPEGVPPDQGRLYPPAEPPQPVSPQAPESAPPQQWAAGQTSGAPSAQQPWPDSGNQPQPYGASADYGSPQQVWPQSEQPTSVPPYSWPQTSAPTSLPGFDDSSPSRRRIQPSPRPTRGQLVLGLLVGLLAGVLIAGTAGFFVGRGAAGGTPATTTPSAQSRYLASLVATNRAKFSGELATLASPWLADISGCVSNADSGGPALASGDSAHVLCRDGAMYVHFVAYSSPAATAAARDFRQQLALATPAIMSGMTQPGRKLGGTTNTPGTYVEYAVRTKDDPALCGVWWDRDGSTSAVYVEVLCDTLGGTFEPLRDLWQRHS
jgi:hypothetical protein